MTETAFLTTVRQDIEAQAAELMQDFHTRVNGLDYDRTAMLSAIFPGIKVRPVPNRATMTPDDIVYSTWLTGELQGRLRAQLAHKDMQALTPLAENYNFMLHALIVGALRAELGILAGLLKFDKAPPEDINDALNSRLEGSNGTGNSAQSTASSVLPTSRAPAPPMRLKNMQKLGNRENSEPLRASG
jgi:hypothetical protein